MDQLLAAAPDRPPTLMMNGRHDWLFPAEISQLPLFEPIGAPPAEKRHVLRETGHSLPRVNEIAEVLAWLDRCLGPAT
jgi:eukaryotic-like serine/threonine-protein kinase